MRTTRGKLLGVDADITIDVGAYSVWPFTVVPRGHHGRAATCPGPMHLPAYRCRTYCVATNKPPIVPYRGVARTGVCFAIELTIDAVARAVGREPCDVRLTISCRPPPCRTPTSPASIYDSGDYPQSVARRASGSNLAGVRARQRRRGGRRRAHRRRFCDLHRADRRTARRCSRGRASRSFPGFEQATVRITPDGGARSARRRPFARPGHGDLDGADRARDPRHSRRRHRRRAWRHRDDAVSPPGPMPRARS